MNSTIFLVGVLIAGSLLIAGPRGKQERKASNDPEKELIQLELDLAQAVNRKDFPFLERLTADDFIGYNPSGKRLTKADVLAQNQSPDFQLESLRHEDIQIRVFGDCAVATARSVVKGRFKGQDASGEYRYMRVWIKRGGHWQGVAAQSTAIPES